MRPDLGEWLTLTFRQAQCAGQRCAFGDVGLGQVGRLFLLVECDGAYLDTLADLRGGRAGRVFESVARGWTSRACLRRMRNTANIVIGGTNIRSFQRPQLPV